MKVAQIAPPWFAVPPERYGGIEWVVALLADGLADRGHETTLYASGGSKTRAKLISIFEEPPGASFIGDPWYDSVQAVSAYQNASDYDIIHDHSGLVGPAIGSFAGVPVVHTLHGPFTDKAKEFYTLMSGHLWYVAISEAQRAFCPDLSYAGTVHNGIKVDLYPFREEKEDFLLFLGRVNREKGPELAIEVAHRTGRKLVMAVKMAEEFEKEYWRDVVEPRLDGSEEIIGEITIEEKADLLARARATLFPIQWPEPFGLVMTESMASGTPVLAFPYGAAPEVIVDGKTGFLPTTIDEMCEAVERVGEIKAADCRRHVEEHFSDDAMVEGYLRCYERVIDGKV